MNGFEIAFIFEMLHYIWNCKMFLNQFFCCVFYIDGDVLKQAKLVASIKIMLQI